MPNCKQRKTSYLHRRYQEFLINASGEVVVAVVAATAHCTRVATITEKRTRINNFIEKN
jgi:hypothetical protein